MKLFPFRAAASALLAISASFSAFACTSSSSNGAGGGASPADYCSALQSYVSKCNVTDPCTLATQQNCTAYASALSSQALSATVSCSSSMECGDAGEASIGQCIAAKQATFTPSAAQLKLAGDFCSACASTFFAETVAECTTAVFAHSADAASVVFTPAQFGPLILEFSDSFATSADTACIPTLGADAGFECFSSFETCMNVQLQKVVTTPAACVTQTGGPGPDAG